eukprot:symbB.v1.2.033386.t1/scaffold4123.1/size58836/6
MDLTKAPSESSKLQVSYDLQQSIFGDLHAEMDAQLSSSTPGSGTSDRSKYAFFALQRAIERLRSFYYVLLVAFGCLISGVFLLVLTEILWLATRLTTGPVAEAVISGFSALGWLLVSATVAIASTCPVDELDFNAFVTPRPVLCIFLATLPLITSVTRVLDLPIPRWISCAVSLLMFVYACLYSQCCGTNWRRFLPSFAVLMEVWYLDVIVGSTVNEVALDEDTIWTDVLLALHASSAVVLQCCLWWKGYGSTVRFNYSSHMALSWQSCYFFCRAIDLLTGHKEWDAERQLDVAVGAAMAFAVAALLPLITVWVIGREYLFQRLSDWVDQRRRLQEGAFMAMLLDSYLVEIDQPWWLSEAEAASSQDLASWIPKMEEKSVNQSGSKAKKSVTRSVSLPLEDTKRPGFVKGRVVAVADDAKSFYVELPDGKGMQVHRNQQVLPWPELLEQGRRTLRCVDWTAQTEELWMHSHGTGYELSRPVGRGEIIDFFVSHSWSDPPARKWNALKLVAENFHASHGRFPTFWVDKVCINQRQIADGLRVLPVNVMACREVLVLCGPTYPTRLWCAWELCVLLSFMHVQEALNHVVVMPLSEAALLQLTTFDCSVSSCYDPNEELRLRHVIDAIGTERFESKIRQLGQLIFDRDLSKSRGLLVDKVLGDCESGEVRRARECTEGSLPPDPVPAIPDIPVASISVKISEGSDIEMSEGEIVQI